MKESVLACILMTVRMQWKNTKPATVERHSVEHMPRPNNLRHQIKIVKLKK